MRFASRVDEPEQERVVAVGMRPPRVASGWRVARGSGCELEDMGSLLGQVN